MENKLEEKLEALARRQGARPFLIDAASGRTVSYREFYEEIIKYGNELKRLGVSKGSRVLLMMDNGTAFAAAYFAVLHAAGAAVPVNTGLKRKELLYIMEDTRAAGILFQEPYGSVVEAAGFSGAVRAGTDSFYCPLYPDSPADLPEGTAMLLYTSGTTGHPKGVILSFDNLMAKTEDISAAHQLTAQDRVLCVLPWFHINGLVITLLTPLVTEGTVVIGGRFSVSRFWGYVEQYGITWFSGVPTMFSHMLSRGIPEYGHHSGLRFARSASSALPGAVLREFEELCGVPVIESYGITEGCSQITSNPLPPAAHKPGSVGIPYGNEIRIVKESGEEAAAGESGEVWIRGENITCGYYHKPEETKRSFTDGWFHSGDIGCLDEDGYLFLSGRIKELINRAGEKFSPLEIDEVLYELPQVELAAAVGVPDPVYGEAVACFIKCREGASLTGQEVKDWCAERIAGYKVPARVIFTETFPQGGNGKIQRLKLLELLGREDR